MNDEKEKIEIEVALRDGMSAGLKQIVRDLDAQNRKIRETAGAGSKSFNQLNDDLTKLGKRTKGATQSFDLFGSAIRSLTTGALRPVGIAAGIAATGVAIGSAVKNFANTNLSINKMAINAGFSTDQFLMLSQALQRERGMTKAQANAITTEAGVALGRMGIWQEGSQLYKDLVIAGVDDATLKEALKFTAAGDNYSALQVTLRDWRTKSQGEKEKIAAAYHTDLATIEAFIEGVPKYEPEAILGMEESARLTELMNALTEPMISVWNAAGNIMNSAFTHTLEDITELIENIQKLSFLGIANSLLKIASWPRNIYKGATEEFPTLPKLPPGLAAGGIVSQPTTIVAGEQGPEAILPLALWQQMGDRAQRLTRMLDAVAGNKPSSIKALHDILSNELALSAAGRQAAVRSSGAGMPVDDRGSAYKATRDLLDKQRLERTERSSSTTLTDIRGTLERMENPLGAVSMAFGGRVDRPTQAVVGHGPELVNGQLVTRPTKVTLPAGSEVTPLDSKKLPIPRAYNNPGDIKYGPWAQAHGAIGGGTRGLQKDRVPHAVFASIEEGRSALEELLIERGVTSVPLSATNKWYATDTQWAAGISKIMGIKPGDIPTDVYALSGAIMRQEGFFSGSSDALRDASATSANPLRAAPPNIPSPKNKIELEIDFAGLKLNDKPAPGFKDSRTLVRPGQGALAAGS